MEAKTNEELWEYRNQRLRHLVRHAYENAPAIRAKFDGAGIKPEDVQTVKDLAKIPVTTKDELVRLQRETPPFGGFLATPPGEPGKNLSFTGPSFRRRERQRTGQSPRGNVRSGESRPG